MNTSEKQDITVVSGVLVAMALVIGFAAMHGHAIAQQQPTTVPPGGLRVETTVPETTDLTKGRLLFQVGDRFYEISLGRGTYLSVAQNKLRLSVHPLNQRTILPNQQATYLGTSHAWLVGGARPPVDMGSLDNLHVLRVSLLVYKNGIRQFPGVDYTEDPAIPGKITPVSAAAWPSTSVVRADLFYNIEPK